VEDQRSIGFRKLSSGGVRPPRRWQLQGGERSVRSPRRAHDTGLGARSGSRPIDGTTNVQGICMARSCLWIPAGSGEVS
jgi:hypothetical protein